MVLLERQWPGTGEGDICSQTTTKYKFSESTFFSFFHRVLYLDSFFIEVKHNLYGHLTNNFWGSHESKYYFSLVWREYIKKNSRFLDHHVSNRAVVFWVKSKKSCDGDMKQRIGETLTFPIYSDKRSWRAWRTELHSATMRSLRSSRVHEESAMRAAPLIMLSRRSSKEGRKRSSLNARGSTMICFCKKRSRREITTAGKTMHKSSCYSDLLLSKP